MKKKADIPQDASLFTSLGNGEFGYNVGDDFLLLLVRIERFGGYWKTWHWVLRKMDSSYPCLFGEPSNPNGSQTKNAALKAFIDYEQGMGLDSMKAYINSMGDGECAYCSVWNGAPELRDSGSVYASKREKCAKRRENRKDAAMKKKATSVEDFGVDANGYFYARLYPYYSMEVEGNIENGMVYAQLVVMDADGSVELGVFDLDPFAWDGDINDEAFQDEVAMQAEYSAHWDEAVALDDQVYMGVTASRRSACAKRKARMASTKGRKPAMKRASVKRAQEDGPFTFDELSEEAKQHAIDNWYDSEECDSERDLNMEEELKSVEDFFKSIEVGFDEKDVYGFPNLTVYPGWETDWVYLSEVSVAAGDDTWIEREMVDEWNGQYYPVLADMHNKIDEMAASGGSGYDNDEFWGVVSDFNDKYTEFAQELADWACSEIKENYNFYEADENYIVELLSEPGREYYADGENYDGGHFASAKSRTSMKKRVVAYGKEMGRIDFGDFVYIYEQDNIQTSFWFGESGYDYDEVRDTVNQLSSDEQYFIDENLRRQCQAWQMLQRLDEGDTAVIYHAYSNGGNEGAITFTKRNIDTQEDIDSLSSYDTFFSQVFRNFGGRVLDDYEVSELREMLEEQVELYRKRLARYLKRYGLEKCNFGMYWMDR